MNEIALQLLHIRQSFLLHPLLTQRTLPPTIHIGFISADMNIFRRKYLHHFQQYILQKSKGIFIADTNFRINIRFSGARQMRKHSQHFFRMPRHLYFRNNRDMTLPGILHNFPCIFLSIISTVCTGSILRTILAPAFPPGFPIGIRAIGCLLRQFRITFDFQSPTRTVCQMPMKAIQLIACHGIELFLEKFFGTEMTRNIQM